MELESQTSRAGEESIEDFEGLNEIFPKSMEVNSEEELDSFFMKTGNLASDDSAGDLFQRNLLDDLAQENDSNVKDNLSQQYDEKPSRQRLFDIFADHSEKDFFRVNSGLSSPNIPGTFITPQKVRVDNESKEIDTPSFVNEAVRVDEKRKIRLPNDVKIMIPKANLRFPSKAKDVIADSDEEREAHENENDTSHLNKTPSNIEHLKAD